MTDTDIVDITLGVVIEAVEARRKSSENLLSFFTRHLPDKTDSIEAVKAQIEAYDTIIRDISFFKTRRNNETRN